MIETRAYYTMEIAMGCTRFETTVKLFFMASVRSNIFSSMVVSPKYYFLCY